MTKSFFSASAPVVIGCFFVIIISTCLNHKMTRASLLESFTLDDEINAWVAGDESIELRGYVDLIEGMKTVNTGPPGNKKPSSLFKVVINNGNRSRVRLLFWGDLALKYSPLIQDRTIMTISRGRTTLPNPRYRNAHETTAHLEVVMLSGTTITIDTVKFEDEVNNIADIPVVKIEDVVNTDGKMYVDGYLKQPFAKVTAYGGIHGGGVIVNEKFKLQIKVIRYEEKKELKKGCFLRILGRVTLHAEGAPILTVQSTEDITLIDKTTPLTEKDLRTIGFQTPKRKHEGSIDESSKKKSPFDS